jgi:hypothetical protein
MTATSDKINSRAWADLSLTVNVSVKMQCCGSGMFIPDPDFYPSRIPDPKTATKERGEKKKVVTPFLLP